MSRDVLFMSCKDGATPLLKQYGVIDYSLENDRAGLPLFIRTTVDAQCFCSLICEESTRGKFSCFLCPVSIMFSYDCSTTQGEIESVMR